MTFATFVTGIVGALNTYVVPTLFALVFVAFIWGAARYFIFESSDEAREKGRQFMLWGLFGIVALVALWGIVNLSLSTLGISATG